MSPAASSATSFPDLHAREVTSHATDDMGGSLFRRNDVNGVLVRWRVWLRAQPWSIQLLGAVGVAAVLLLLVAYLGPWSQQQPQDGSGSTGAIRAHASASGKVGGPPAGTGGLAAGTQLSWPQWAAAKASGAPHTGGAQAWSGGSAPKAAPGFNLSAALKELKASYAVRCGAACGARMRMHAMPCMYLHPGQSLSDRP